MKKKYISSPIPPTKPSKSFTSADINIIPTFLTNTVTDATFRSEGNAPVPSGYSVREARRFSVENKL